jgi:hypothetical protein
VVGGEDEPQGVDEQVLPPDAGRRRARLVLPLVAEDEVDRKSSISK